MNLNDIHLSFRERCALRRYRRKWFSAEKIYHFKYLNGYGMLDEMYPDGRDADGFPVGVPVYRTSDVFDRYLINNQWFSLEYVISHILIPILVGVAASAITTYLTRVL